MKTRFQKTMLLIGSVILFFGLLAVLLQKYPMPGFALAASLCAIGGYVVFDSMYGYIRQSRQARLLVLSDDYPVMSSGEKTEYRQEWAEYYRYLNGFLPDVHAYPVPKQILPRHMDLYSAVIIEAEDTGYYRLTGQILSGRADNDLVHLQYPEALQFMNGLEKARVGVTTTSARRLAADASVTQLMVHCLQFKGKAVAFVLNNDEPYHITDCGIVTAVELADDTDGVVIVYYNPGADEVRSVVFTVADARRIRLLADKDTIPCTDTYPVELEAFNTAYVERYMAVRFTYIRRIIQAADARKVPVLVMTCFDAGFIHGKGWLDGVENKRVILFRPSSFDESVTALAAV